jgi:8-amino-7-oxononanoate synthase
MSRAEWPAWLAAQAQDRAEAGLTRQLTPRDPHDRTLDLAGNDYLGLARHPEVTQAAAAAAKEWGAGAGASRLVTGTTSLHRELEAALAQALGQPAALVTSTGYHANLAVVAALGGRDALVVSDAHNHASLIDAARLSRGDVVVVGHHDLSGVRRALAAADGRRAMVVVESVYSVLGDAAPLVALEGLCREHGALLVVDEAHGLGVAGEGGRGLVAELGLAGLPHVAVTATLSKSLGSQGGVVLGSTALIEHLVNRARPFIYDTGLAPPAAAGALAALRHLVARPELPTVVARRIAGLAAALEVAAPAGAVLSVPMPSPRTALAAQAEALAAGVRVGCFRPPSTPDGSSRLRITASAGLSDPEWAHAVEVVRQVVGSSS